LHVLVVDDNSSARIILTEALASFGFRVKSAESGLKALDMLHRASKQNDPFALVLLDWKMPGLDGLETAKRITEDHATKTPPQLLMVSASNMEDCRHQGINAGIRGFLHKPVTRSHLFDAIVGVFAREKSETGEEGISAVPGDESGSEPIIGLEVLKGARVLLVEDNEINQQIAVELLQQTGTVVTTANNGKEALDILLRQQFDAVLMDIQMPIMDGLEAARLARDLPVPGIRSLPILAMTAHAMESDRMKSLQAGMQEHLTKPIDPRKMYESLAKWIRSDVTPVAHPGAAAPGVSGDMPGLSVQTALKNLGGNESLYKKLFGRFIESYEHAPRQVSEALQAGDQQLAVRLAHTVRGVAANLGALSLASVAGDLEKALAANMEHSALLAQMSDVLRQTIESMRCLAGASQEPTDTDA
jgi:CheY-like chemotaxis protein